jgi:prepilin-type N-terminal cleavage/methylation domain-containing protein
MLKNFKTKNKMQKGFTIIEVMIVLAIAGLILVVVLIAIPQLQRNQRNSARQANAARMVSELSNYAGNNNGKIPQDQTELNNMYLRYLAEVNTEDPTTGESTPIVITTYGSLPFVPAISTDPATITYTDVDHDNDSNTPDLRFPQSTGTGELGVAFYATNTSCDGEEVTDVGAGSRNFTLVTVLEGGAVYCLDNK